MTSSKVCPACARQNGEGARFCRKCGAALDTAPHLDSNAATPSRRLGSGATDAPATEDARILRELALLCTLPLLISIAATIAVRVDGVSATKDIAATSAMALLALVGSALNARLILSALRPPTLRDGLMTGLLALVAAPVLVGAFSFLQHVLEFPLFDGYLAPYLRDGFPAYLGYLEVAVVTPIAEELLFRGLVQPKLERMLTANEAWIVQAALFAAVHLSPVILVTHFAMGLALGYTRRSSGSLYPGILLHGAWNAWVIWSSHG